MSAKKLKKHPRKYFLNVPFDSLDMQELKEAVFASSKRPFSYLVTPNVLHVVRADRSPCLTDVLRAAEYSVCDSQILRMLAKIRGIRLELVRGSDFVEFLMENQNNKCGEKIHFGVIGSSADQIRQLKQKYTLSIVAHHVPPMGFIDMPDEMATAANFLRNHPVDVWILALGMPQQEYLAKMVASETDCHGIALCVGASLDFLSGVENRAPKWMSSIGLEWLWRLLQDPLGKWQRYLLEAPRVFLIFIRDTVGFGRKNGQSPDKTQ